MSLRTQFVVSVPVLSETMRFIFDPSDGTFAISVRDICVLVGRDIALEYERARKRFGHLAQLSPFDTDRSPTDDYILPMDRLQEWLDSMPLPPMKTGTAILKDYRKNLYAKAWSLLAQSVWSKNRRVKWTELAKNGLITDEQIGAEWGVPPEAVRAIAMLKKRQEEIRGAN